MFIYHMSSCVWKLYKTIFKNKNALHGSNVFFHASMFARFLGICKNEGEGQGF